jgi:hypothetical protein
MTKLSADAATQWAVQESLHRAEKRIVNRKFLASFALIVFLLVLAVAAATLLADFIR